ncbi:hypothetical protein [Paraburkholderia sp. GAS41]|uniref:hypothetical protein n=1 Tax=Paraburkholderia sp. GAS41 TaxID=3035134 RepID=UPI003D24B765
MNRRRFTRYVLPDTYISHGQHRDLKEIDATADMALGKNRTSVSTLCSVMRITITNMM